MPNTVPYQKTVVIHREMPKTNFLQIKDENWMEFNKKLGPYALQLYLYLADNRDGFSLALSQQAAENEAGIAKTTFHKYVNLLIDEGYLVQRNGNTYDFYETPHKQEDKNLKRSPCGKSNKPQREQQNLSHESRNFSDSLAFPQSNKEINIIDNTDITDNQQIETSIQRQWKETDKVEEPEQGFNF